MDKALDYLSSAQSLKERGKESQKILDQLGYAQAYLNRADERSNLRRQYINDILVTRRAAIEAGAASDPTLSGTLSEHDDSLRGRLMDLLGTNQDWTLLSERQKRYSRLELAAIKQKYLGSARAELKKTQGSMFKAPVSLEKAYTSIANAESVIEADRHNPELFKL